MTAVFGVVVPDVCSHMKASGYSETLVSVCHTTQRHPPEGRNLDIYRIQKIKCHIVVMWFSSGRAKHL
jgi:hypothetical protein